MPYEGCIAIQQHRQLLTGDRRVRLKGGLARALCDIVFHCPAHRIGIIRIGGRIGKRILCCRCRRSGLPPEEGDRLASRYGFVRAKGRGARPLGDAIFDSPAHGIIIISAGGHVGKPGFSRLEDGLYGVGLVYMRKGILTVDQLIGCIDSIHVNGGDLVSVLRLDHEVLRCAVLYPDCTRRLDGSAWSGRGGDGLRFSEQVGENFVRCQIAIAVRIGERTADCPAELTGGAAAERGVARIILVNIVVPAVPLRIVPAHVGAGELHRLTVFTVPNAVDLYAAAAHAADAGRRRGMQDHQTAVVTCAKANPDMAVHAHDIARLKIRAADDLCFAAPAKICEVLCHGCRFTYVTRASALRVHGIVNRPADIARAVRPCKVILVPAAERIIALCRVGILI